MSVSKKEAAERLIAWHFEVEPELIEVFRIVGEDEESAAEPIKLLEVNAATVATGSVEPFSFAPSTETPFRTVVAEVTPEELERIRRNEISLPRGWSLDTAEQLKRPRVA